MGLRGLLLTHVLSMDEQIARFMTNLRDLPNDLEKYVALNSLRDRNEALFFRIVVRQHRRNSAANLHPDGGAWPASGSA